MGFVYVARSASLAKWGSDVGLGKNLFKVGWHDGPAEAAVAALNAESCAGQTDWQVVGRQEADDRTDTVVVDNVARKEKAVDPTLYPKIRGAAGIFKVKLENVENHQLLQQAMANLQIHAAKLKPADIAAYLMALAMK